jgi:hypothetical protein
MSESDKELEEGQIPAVNVPNDGSFMANYLKGEVTKAEPDAAPRCTNNERPPSLCDEGQAQPQAEGGAPALAPAAAPPKPAKPPAVLKSKRSILAKRLPPGAQLPAKKKTKEKGRRGAAAKSGAANIMILALRSVHAVLFHLSHRSSCGCVCPPHRVLCVQLPTATAAAPRRAASRRKSRFICRKWRNTGSSPATRPEGTGPW